MIKADNHQELSKLIFTYEKTASLPAEAIDFIYKKKLFKFFVPEEDGGLGLSLPDSLTLLAEVTKIDGNLGWLLSTGSGASYFYGFMQPAVARKVFSTAVSVISGSGHPSGIARRVKGGYRVSGQWKYCSGAEIATYFTFNCKVEPGDDIMAFIFRPSQVVIKEDWTGFGLKLTSSHTISIDNIFVQEDHTFDISQTPWHSNPVYGLPFLPFAQASLATVGQGIAEKLLQVSEALAEQNRQNWGAERHHFVKNKLEKSADALRKAKNAVMAEAESGWSQLHAGELEKEWPATIDRLSKRLSRCALEAGSEVIPYLGMEAIKEDSYLNYLWRNLQTACQHVLVTPFEEQQ